MTIPLLNMFLGSFACGRIGMFMCISSGHCSLAFQHCIMTLSITTWKPKTTLIQSPWGRNINDAEIWKQVANSQQHILVETWLHLWYLNCNYRKDLANNHPRGCGYSPWCQRDARHPGAKNCLVSSRFHLQWIFIALNFNVDHHFPNATLSWVYPGNRKSPNSSHMPKLCKRIGHFIILQQSGCSWHLWPLGLTFRAYIFTQQVYYLWFCWKTMSACFFMFNHFPANHVWLPEGKGSSHLLLNPNGVRIILTASMTWKTAFEFFNGSSPVLLVVSNR